MSVKTFIDRPILSAVISIAIVIVGLIGLSQLPIEQFPDIAPPTVRVSATYTGANAETVMKSVITPLEEQLNGVENMMYMTSTATNTGAATVSVYFRQGTDPDMSVVNVQNRVSSAQGLLPAEVTKSGVTVRKRQNSSLKAVTLYSPDDSYDANFLTNYMKINIEPQMSRIAGVGEVNIWGASYSMRIWLDPLKMAQYGLMPSDISTVLAEQNVESPTGTLGAESSSTFQYVLKYRGRYEQETDYGNMVIKSLPTGEVLRLKDVATIELGAENYALLSQTSGHPGANCMIAQTSGSNANEIIKQIDATSAQISESLPKGMVLTDIMSTKDFLDASIENVVETLLLAIVLVVLVVYLFLHDLRATLIPTLAIIVSLVGTFAFIYAAGFSLNLLTLFAIVLVIGTVVDNAIVVVEAVQAKFDEGYTSAYQATVDALGGLTSALVTTTVVFMAVFIPVCFMGGTTGTFYTQFGLTMAVAVAISLVNALTLSPALCALIMRPSKLQAGNAKPTFSQRFHFAFDHSFRHLLGSYSRGVALLFRHKYLASLSVVAAVALLAWLLNITKTGLVPLEDMGTININVQTAPGSSLAETEKVMNEVENAISDIEQVKIYSRVTGKDARHNQSSSAGSFTLRLKPWDQRTKAGDDQNAVIEEIYRRTDHIKTAQIRVSTQPMISGYGTSDGFELYVQDKKGGSVDDLLKYTRNFIDAMNKKPEISRAYTTFDNKYPQYQVDVDAALCKRNGVSPTDVLNTLAGYVGGSYSSNLNRFTKLYRVMVQASPEFRLDTSALNNIFVRNSSGEMSPLAQYVTLTRVYGSESLSRFNLFSAIAVYGTPAEGYSSGQAIDAVREAAREALPEGYGYEFGGMAREEAGSSGTTTQVFVICIVFIYLILCALYESVMIPFAVILSVPFGLAGSFIFAQIWGLENNIYMQTGLIMLIGLLSKTAILLTEYASSHRRKGMSISAAAMAAAKARLRPILMTSLTMIFGMLPLMFAKGVGANGNMSVGVGTVGGMLLGTAALLFVVPPLFIVFQWLEERFVHLKPKRAALPLAAIAVSLGLNSCGVYGTYSRPEQCNPTEQILRDNVAYADSAAPMPVAWRQFFTDPDLQSLIEAAVERNTDLNVARLQIEEAQATLMGAKLSYLPSLSLNPQAGVSHYNGDTKRTYNLGATASWELDIFGKVTNAKREAAAALVQSQAYVKAVQTSLVATVAENYYSLVMLDEQLAISEATLNLWDETITTLQALVEAGKANDVAVHQARASRNALEASVLTLKKSVNEIENSLASLTKMPPAPIKRGKLANQTLGASISKGVSLEALAARPDVQQAEAALAQTFYSTNIARSAFYPSIVLSGTIGWTNNGGGAIINPGKWLSSALASLTAPLFSKGTLTANLRIAEARQQEALLRFEQTLFDAGNEVNDAIIEWQTADGRMACDRRQIEELHQAVERSKWLMQYTSANYLEVLTAQQSLLSAQLTLAQDASSRIAAAIHLYHSLGGGV